MSSTNNSKNTNPAIIMVIEQSVTYNEKSTQPLCEWTKSCKCTYCSDKRDQIASERFHLISVLFFFLLGVVYPIYYFWDFLISWPRY
ncbi:hypothetical protein CONCODRAFT_6936 [Conidiobolus coronatus NRRL 28638]|uniref:Uncharacterized protein n=1 Tax=Conidiobolus coronatus (strain ATCC 28846 / CBS 209.66 / NRRL 28638) TaxID=796925 RepID=A0A137P6D0_CONC2|nr:hypothetical protein CONCODRAFT_6936 [Conidiobolus coronatus NRRL 28638]|eukprot:KXN70519.1 hypothetical protein CONCODRAFT_6936 [Conidiobolus coronatus NRRL 28638]